METLLEKLEQQENRLYIVSNQDEKMAIPYIKSICQQMGRDYTKDITLILLKYWYEPVLANMALDSGMFNHIQDNLVCLESLHDVCLDEARQKAIIRTIDVLQAQKNYVFFILSTDADKQKIERAFIERFFPNTLTID